MGRMGTGRITTSRTYSELLRDPRWQQVRLRVMERAGFACERCGDMRTELQIHHLWYERIDPWEYPYSALLCVCRRCHEHLEAKRLELLKAVALLGGDTQDNADILIGIANGIAGRGADRVIETQGTGEYRSGVAAALAVSVETLDIAVAKHRRTVLRAEEIYTARDPEVHDAL